MCGIAGFIGAGDETDIRKMTAAIEHRGPDGEGYFVDEINRVFLGHRLLSVIDISDGAQPMWNRSHSIGVIFNGEIYNHRNLRSELESLGHQFTTDHSDTEVLVHGYEQWGENLPEHLNGMFAFAIYDRRNHQIFLSRDRFGEKPLFFTDQPGLFAFASEINSLLCHSALAPNINPVALQKFFAFGFLPAPWTPYKNIFKLHAGQSLTYRLKEMRLTKKRYWKFKIEPFERKPSLAEEKDWAQELRHLLSQAVHRRLESDVPLGFLLSGGIDSSAILALAAEHMDAERIESFTIGFTEPSFDESGFASSMAQRVGSNHHLEICDFDAAMTLIPSILAKQGEPIGDSSIIPSHMVCEFARRNVTVALSGDGGDELFAGYDPFKALALAQWYQRLVPKKLHNAVCLLAARMPKSDANMSLDFKLRRSLRGVYFRPALWNPVWMGALGPDDISDLFSEHLDVDELYSEAIELWDNCASDNHIDRTMEFFTNLYLSDDILVKSDRASMGVSLELRTPFLDIDLVNFARRLPASVKFAKGEGKLILKKALEGILPDDIIRRRKKGFGIPLSRWLKNMPIPPLDDPKLQSMDMSWLADKWHRHATGKTDERHALWCWLALHHMPLT
ncbi:MAG: asparagine synthase (glutamine-hydrolyzing) [Rhodospirillales bacterium]|nr:asparagine synthase (glutamine-hydrolyzing) [Rhodospirillales bacterium]